MLSLARPPRRRGRTASYTHTLPEPSGNVQRPVTSIVRNLASVFLLVLASTACERKPVPTPRLSGVTAIAAGTAHTCAIANGTAHCWGRDQWGQASGEVEPDPDRTRTVPRARPLPSQGPVDTLHAGDLLSCAGKAGEVRCWGRIDLTVGPDSTPRLRGARHVALHHTQACAELADAGVSCRGYGDVGDGRACSSGCDWHPIRPPISGVRALASGGAVVSGTRCAIDATGAILCWGALPWRDHRWCPPEPVTGIDDASEVVVGLDHACALRRNEVWCWGDDEFGQLGERANGDALAAKVIGLPPIDRIAASTTESCGRAVDGRLFCWGTSSGNDVVKPNRKPTVRSTPAPVVTIVGGEAHMCALLATSEVWCWGANGYGQLGDPASKESGFVAVERQRSPSANVTGR